MIVKAFCCMASLFVVLGLLGVRLRRVRGRQRSSSPAFVVGSRSVRHPRMQVERMIASLLADVCAHLAEAAGLAGGRPSSTARGRLC